MRDYRRYYGRRPSRFRGVLKGVAIGLLILALLLAATSLFLQRYLVYEDGGIRLELPWDREEPDASPSPSPSATPSKLPIIKEEKPVGSAPPPPDPTPVIHGVRLSVDALSTGAFEAALNSSGANAVILTMKEDSGALNYVSSNDLAMAAGASAADLSLNAAIRELTAGELYTVAEVSCFRDHLLPTWNSELRLQTNSGFYWEDHEDVRWSSPAHGEVADYLTAICVELAELGFDEILLTHPGYPAAREGNLEWLPTWEAYPRGELDTVISPFLAGLKAALEPYGVNLSVRASAAELAGEDADTGLTADGILAACDRVWVDSQERDTAAQALLAHTPGADLSRLLVGVGVTPGGQESSWALFN